MHIEIGFGEVLASLVGIITLVWALLKVTIGQFEARLVLKFDSIDGKFNSIDKKFATFDTLVLEVKKLEIEQLRRDNQYSEKFATKSEIEAGQLKHDKTVERIFALLQTMSDKLDNKVNRADCDTKCHMVRASERNEQ